MNLADFIEANPDLNINGETVTYIYTPFRSEFVEVVRKMVKYGKVEKRMDQSMPDATLSFGPHKIRAFTSKEQVCRKVEVKTQIPELVIPAKPELVIPAHEEVKVTWECLDSLLAPVDDETAKEMAVAEQTA